MMMIWKILENILIVFDMNQQTKETLSSRKCVNSRWWRTNIKHEFTFISAHIKTDYFAV